MKAIFFPNGNTMFFNDKGGQVPELQRSWFLLYIDFLVSKGVDPFAVKYYLSGTGKAHLIKTTDGYNWKIESG